MVGLLHLRAFSWLVLSLVFGSCTGAAWRCPLAPVATGAQLLDTTTITHDGIPRSWYTYVPASVAAAQADVPLVIDLHGVYDCASAQLTYTGWLVKAEEFGLIVAWPQAEDEPIGENGFTAGARWNAGGCDECLCENCVFKGQGNTCCLVDANATNVPNDVDDVGFLRAMVAQVANANPVDITRVYFTGHSYGCFMAQRMLAQASDLVAAVACFSGAMALSSELGVFPLSELSSDYTPRPLMVIHGTADAIVPYEPASFPYANAPYPIPGAEANLALWGSYNGCPEEAATETALDNYTLHEINCNGVVSALVEMPGVGHWPFYHAREAIEGFDNYDELGPVASFDTTQLAWDFLKAASIILLPDILSAAFNSCPVGCVSANARQRGKLSFGSFCPESPDSCVST